ncbi:MAG TPA: imidazole glycerol phosphate synthase subunit HisH [Candidatus Dormibacteraeota bacterium]|nr:imidazole glycerol phosphate synthase subunit HisH [Candidatus Dormibacteraeota bacterium]
MIALVDYGAGNLRSVQNALDALEVGSAIASTPEDLARADAIIFPGVGAAGPAMAALRARGLDRALLDVIRQGRPFLGICLGLQLLFDSSAEDGATCLGIFRGTVQRLPTQEKLPHVGWNTVERAANHPVLAGLEGEAMYFVHSYVGVPADRQLVAAETTHGVSFVSAIAAGSMVAVQFHPERSGRAGLKLLENFVQFARVGVGHVAQADHSLS